MTRDELICFQCGKVIGTKAKTTTVKGKGRLHRSCFERTKEATK